MTGGAMDLNTASNSNVRALPLLGFPFADQIPGQNKFLHHFALDQMSLNDLLQHFRHAGVIPDRFRVNHCNGATDADAQTIDFAPIDQRLRSHQLKLFKAFFEEFPRPERRLAGSAERLGLVGA